MLGSLSERKKKWAKWVGLPLFGIFAYGLFLYVTLPLSRIVDIAVDGASRAGYDLKIGDISRGIVPGKVSLSDVVLSARPKRPGDSVTKIMFDKVDLDIALWKLKSNIIDLGFAARIDDGKLSGHFKRDKRGQVISAKTSEFPMEMIPGVSSSIQNLPLSGGVGLKLDLTLPESRWDKANGRMTIKCDSNCVVGSEKAITQTPIQVGDLDVDIDIVKGIASIKKFAAKSADGELEVVGSFELKQPVSQSEMHLCIRFKLDPTIMAKSENLRNALNFAQQGKLSDGRYQYRREGRFSQPRGQWTQSCPYDQETPEVARVDLPPSVTTQIAETAPPAAAMPVDTTAQAQAATLDFAGAPTPPPAIPSPEVINLSGTMGDDVVNLRAEAVERRRQEELARGQGNGTTAVGEVFTGTPPAPADVAPVNGTDSDGPVVDVGGEAPPYPGARGRGGRHDVRSGLDDRENRSDAERQEERPNDGDRENPNELNVPIQGE